MTEKKMVFTGQMRLFDRFADYGNPRKKCLVFNQTLFIISICANNALFCLCL